MECTSEFRELANHNPFIEELVLEGYHVDFIGGYLVLYGIPYIDSNKKLQYGDWVSPLNLDGDKIDPPTNNHQAWFRGQRPCDENGTQLLLGGGEHIVFVTENFSTDYSFSYKLQGKDGQLRDYVSFEEKVLTYLATIVTPAINAFPDATPLRGIEVRAAQQKTSLRFPDSMSAKYNINDISRKLHGKTVGVVGLGGTGSYILDFLAKTHLDQIFLFDDDKIHIHTIFRIPGYMPQSIGRKKVEALAEYYGRMHDGIEPVVERIIDTNLQKLDDLDFVFVSLDHAESRGIIVQYLAEKGIPFVDCGMGLTRNANGLNGMTRITGVGKAAYDSVVGTPFLPIVTNAEDEYRTQAQIAEFNALNAAMAVIRFKQHFGLYRLIDDFSAAVFESCSLEFTLKSLEQ